MAYCQITLHHESVSSRSKQVKPLQGCGLVAESHVIDESSEWRSFADSVRLPSRQLSTPIYAALCIC